MLEILQQGQDQGGVGPAHIPSLPSHACLSKRLPSRHSTVGAAATLSVGLPASCRIVCEEFNYREREQLRLAVFSSPGRSVKGTVDYCFCLNPIDRKGGLGEAN